MKKAETPLQLNDSKSSMMTNAKIKPHRSILRNQFRSSQSKTQVSKSKNRPPSHSPSMNCFLHLYSKVPTSTTSTHSCRNMTKASSMRMKKCAGCQRNWPVRSIRWSLKLESLKRRHSSCNKISKDSLSRCLCKECKELKAESKTAAKSNVNGTISPVRIPK